ncbi:hypothetical protein QJS10_CPA06g00950 [Acorus calamus]|uniref:Uncharacterized protein n=1 Tax=Acorus calamus TaxID=4465 RepID=A0AAV9ER25_ACOCL|nr:hypothetical protein QJS10_CPA06g00950 [Acorus calamus]
MKGPKQPLEVILEKDNDSVLKDRRNRSTGDLYTLRIGRSDVLPLLEVTFTDDPPTASAWLRHAHRLLDRRRSTTGKHPVVVAGFRLFRGQPRDWIYCKSPRDISSRPVIAFSLCIGGSHILYFPIEYGVVPRPIADFFADERVVIAGVNVARDAAALEAEMGVRVARAVELAPLVEEAFKGWGGFPILRGFWVRPEEMRKLDVVDLAAIAMEGMETERAEDHQKLEMIDWSYGCEEKDRIKFAAIQAFLACETATRCYRKINGSGVSSAPVCD